MTEDHVERVAQTEEEEREKWPVGDWWTCFDCGDWAVTDDVALVETRPGSYLVCCPSCAEERGGA